MALVTHQMKGSHPTLPTRAMSWNGKVELKRLVTTVNIVAHSARFSTARRKNYLLTGASLFRRPEAESLRITAFKGSAKNDEPRERASGSTSEPQHVKLYCVPKGSRENGTESPKIQDASLPYPSQVDVMDARSLGIENLFRSWLTLLRTYPPDRVLDGSPERSDLGKALRLNNGVQTEGRGGILLAASCYFSGLDATVKIPLIILVPSYLAVNLVYGAEVSKELIPLWVLGPLIIALYVKLFQGLRALYAFSFKRTMGLVKNLHAYYAVASSYIASGNLEDVHSPVFMSVLEIKNSHYKELWKRLSNILQEWVVERYLDFMESIWPYYYRTIRFLKRANLV